MGRADSRQAGPNSTTCVEDLARTYSCLVSSYLVVTDRVDADLIKKLEFTRSSSPRVASVAGWQRIGSCRPYGVEGSLGFDSPCAVN